MDQETAQVRFVSSEDWLNSLGGSLGEEFKRVLNDQQSLAQFLSSHPLQAIQIGDSFFSNFHQTLPQFLPFIVNRSQLTKTDSPPPTNPPPQEKDSPDILEIKLTKRGLIIMLLIGFILFLLFR